MAWTDFETRKVATYKFDYQDGDTVNAFTMVKAGGYLLMSKIVTSAHATPVEGVPHEDWEIISFGDGSAIPTGCTREVIARGTDYTDQVPTALDTPLQVKFGTGPLHQTGSDPVNITTDGAIHINETDNYHFRLSSQYGRTGSGGTTNLWQRVLVNGVQAGVSVLAKLNNANSDFPYQAELTALLPAGVVVTVELWRGSENSGANSGGFYSVAPALAGSGSGFSADVIVSRYVLT